MSKTIYKKSTNIVVQEVGNEKVIIPLSKNVGDMTNVYTLRDVALFVWDNIDGNNSTDDLTLLIIDHYDIDYATAKKDLTTFINQLDNFIIS